MFDLLMRRYRTQAGSLERTRPMKPDLFAPITGSVLPRFAGLATLMRLPYLDFDHEAFSQVDIGLVGIPWDGGTTNRAGARHGPRQVRDLSTMIRNVNRASGINPFALCNCADLGDTPVNPVDVMDSMARIQRFFDRVCDAGVVPLSVGGDHLSTLPIMRALAKNGPVGMVHFDAHTDTWDGYFGGSSTPTARRSAGPWKRVCWTPSGRCKSASVARCTTMRRTPGGSNRAFV